MSLVGALRVYTVTDTIGKAIGGLRERCDHIQYCTIEPHLLIQKCRQYVKSLVTTVGGETEVLFKDIVYTAPPPPPADNAQRPN